MSRKVEVLICGAGIAGVSAAYHLAKVRFEDILIVDPLPPLSLTSDRSTEGYRNWWPDGEMVALMNRSIDIMEQLRAESGNAFQMNRRGYVYFMGNDNRLDEFRRTAEKIAGLGAGPLRVHLQANCTYQAADPKRSDYAQGADLLLGRELVQRYFPYITDKALAALHVRRAGWLSAQQLGMFLLERARGMGVHVEKGEITQVDTTGGRVHGAQLASGERIDCEYFVNAGGPYLRRVGEMLGVEIPVRTELHLKVTFKDALGVLPREAPLLIWDDPQLLPWEPEEIEALREDMTTRWLTEEFSGGAHLRPEGSGESQTVLMLWDYKARWIDPTFPPPMDDLYPEVTLRGLATMLPGLRRYFGRAPRPYLDGGYYVKTPENRLLVGPSPVHNAYVLGGLSGFGIMSSCAAGELLAEQLAGRELPAYAPAFSPERYADPLYQARLADWDHSGEL